MLALLVIGLGVWLLLAGTAYRRQYSGTGVAWHRGANNFIEITLIREDDANLACAADTTVQGLHCGFRADRRASDDAGDDAHLLRPYNTLNGELFLGAGLWDSLARHGGLPAGRFTVTCDFEIVGALRPPALRWTRNGSFDVNDRSLAAGHWAARNRCGQRWGWRAGSTSQQSHDRRWCRDARASVRTDMDGAL